MYRDARRTQPTSVAHAKRDGSSGCITQSCTTNPEPAAGLLEDLLCERCVKSGRQKLYTPGARVDAGSKIRRTAFATQTEDTRLGSASSDCRRPCPDHSRPPPNQHLRVPSVPAEIRSRRRGFALSNIPRTIFILELKKPN
ncbi:MAG: hypothetical protein BJ554DRAFT_5327 [Olpidium bornovanus]|uniref:Uncharacterized protein n=1 Tax=Olpidium bornovanus TaxID=278681 RepID=A0A8H8DKX8_9FUNG|nr:MAG: hypothetical protein BJ554DRAFT_5327 [Olpidium bornovanus]